MKRAARITGLASAAAVVALASGDAAHGGSFALREQSTTGQGQAFAGVAAGSAGLSSMFWNPATLTGVTGLTLESNLAILFPRSEVTPLTGTSPVLLGLGGTGDSGDIGLDAILPSAYVGYEFNERLHLGFAVNTPFGLTTKYDTPFAGQIYAESSRAISFSFNPAVAVEVTDWLSVGAGVQALYFATDLARSLAPGPFPPSARLEGDDLGFGVTAGLTVEPIEGTKIGLGYRSSVDLGLEGDLQLDVGAGVLPAGTYGIDADLTLPEQITVGIEQTVRPDLRVSAGFEWTNWSRLGTVPVIGNEPLTLGAELTTLEFNYDDGYYLSAGAEYDWSPQLTFRAGAAYEWSPIDSDNRDLRLPDTDRVHVNVGAGYNWNENLSIDLAYLHIFAVGDDDIELVEGNPGAEPGLPFVGDVDTDIDILSASLTYRF